MVAIRALVFGALITYGAVAGAQQGGQVLSGALEPGDAVCTNLCDRYGLVWDAGGPVRLRLVTNGFPASLRASRNENATGPVAGNEVQLVATPGTPVFVEIEESAPRGGGLYRLQVEPAPSRVRAPSHAAQVPAQAPPRGGPAYMPAASPPPPRQAPLPMLQPPPGAGAPPDPTRATVETLMRGFRASSPLLVGRLEQVPALSFVAQRGRCYRSVIVLAPGARRRPAGPQTPAPAALARMTLRTARGPEAVTESARSTDRVIAIDDDLCPSENGTLEIAFLDRFRADPVASPGLGPFTVQVFERPAAP